ERRDKNSPPPSRRRHSPNLTPALRKGCGDGGAGCPVRHEVATCSRYVGDVFGSALASEGIFAFFLESGFLALLLFCWEKVPMKIHFLSTVLVCLGAHFSAIWIVVANSWMQTPAGYHIVGQGLKARAEITDFWAMVLNPSTLDRISHVYMGAWQAGAWLVLSVSAYYLLKKRHI